MYPRAACGWWYSDGFCYHEFRYALNGSTAPATIPHGPLNHVVEHDSAHQPQPTTFLPGEHAAFALTWYCDGEDPGTNQRTWEVWSGGAMRQAVATSVIADECATHPPRPTPSPAPSPTPTPSPSPSPSPSPTPADLPPCSPKPDVKPVVFCAYPPRIDPADGSAWCVHRYGYNREEDGGAWCGFGWCPGNSTACVQDIAVGGANKFTPSPRDRGQPTRFWPGEHPDAARVEWNCTTRNYIQWRVHSKHTRTVRMYADALEHHPLCADAVPTPSPAPTPAPAPCGNGTHAPDIDVFVTCGGPVGGGQCCHTFGYDNRGACAYDVPVGCKNKFHRWRADWGQATHFAAGRHAAAFEVCWPCATRRHAWHLHARRTRHATAHGEAGAHPACGS